MDSNLSSLIVFVVFFLVVILFAVFLIVPIKSEKICANYCINIGFEDGFCRKVSLFQGDIKEIQESENANLTEGQCLLNPLALSASDSYKCFCRN